MEAKREYALDRIRAVAVFFTVGMHAMDNIGIYDVQLTGPLPLVTAALRMLFTACVPMFLLLSGWLCRTRTLSRRHWESALRLLETYLLCSLLCLVYRYFAGETITPRYALSALLNFYASGYAWYVMMYLGLLLMMPFLNLAFNHLESRRQRQLLILCLFVLSHLPSLLNARVQLLSVWWKNLYPLTYYFTGAYLSLYRPQLSARKLLGLLALWIALCLGFNRLVYGVEGASLIGVTYDHFEVYGVGLLCFCLLLKLPEPRPALLRRAVSRIAGLSFAAYLLSWISDGVLYPAFAARIPGVYLRLPWALPLALVSFVLALALAQGESWLQSFLHQSRRFERP